MTVTTDTPFVEMRDKLGVPFVVKVPDGSFSAAVFKVKSRADWNEHGRDRFRKGQILIAQAYMPTDFDWRVCTLAGKPLFVAKYFMVRGHWQIQTNAPGGARYGRVESVPRSKAPRAVVKLGVAAASLIGDGLYGVDIKETPDGPVVIEINDNPNIELGYDDAAEGDVIYRDVINYFTRRVREASEPVPQRKPRGRRRDKDPELRALRAPIGRAAPNTPQRPYGPYEVCGLELEYVTIDRDLNVVHRTEQALAALAGHACSDLSLGAVGFSNEIFDHVIELKTEAPHRGFDKLETLLVEGVRRVDGLLARRFGARLLPTGMHPWFNPHKAVLWKRANRAIYDTYDRLFPIYTHGWANVQSCHVNLPLGAETDAVAMMNAAALVVPYLPALAASSPVVEGELIDHACGRMHHLLGHQRKIPESIGDMVPEYMASYKQYRHAVLRPMFKALDRLPGTQELRRDYFNARAAVIKFGRESMEIRALDTQECVRRDVAVALFTRSAVKALAQQLGKGSLALPDHAVLVADLHATVRDGRAARVSAPHLGDEVARDRSGLASARDVLASMLELAAPATKKSDRGYLDDVADIIEHGNLSEKIRAVLAPHAADERAFEDHARRVYIHLADCLIENRAWNGRI
jgi:glutamate--cysteine ligase